MLDYETLIDLKAFFDRSHSELIKYINNISTSKSKQRLVDNRVQGFLIAIQDRIFEMSPELQCQGCGGGLKDLS